MKIWVNTIVYNEENFLWFAVTSIVDFVDKILIWDTGSKDNTVKVIDELVKRYPDKILFKEVGEVSNKDYPMIRQKMLEETKADWVVILDGDEIWSENSIRKLVEKLRDTQAQAIVVPFYNSLGDIYHYQDERFGRYQLLGKKGFLTIRAIKTDIKGLHVNLPYGQEGYFDMNNKPIQDVVKLEYIDAPFLHMTHLKRSSRGQKINKIKYSLGKRIKNFEIPEVFKKPYPNFISDPQKKRGMIFILRSLLNLPKEYILRISL